MIHVGFMAKIKIFLGIAESVNEMLKKIPNIYA